MSEKYRKAGVDEKKVKNIISYIKKKAMETFKKNYVLDEIGFFSGFFKFPAEFKNPVIVSSTDGVGTKILISQILDNYSTIGIDLVGMNVNDVSVSGAKVLFLLDYIAVGELKGKREKEIMDGIVKGCNLSDCALLGGEIAQMKDVYGKDGFDLAAFCVGVVEKSKIVDGRKIKKGDIIVGISSNGVHSNGFSLVRKIFKKNDYKKYYEELGSTLGEELLKPTFIYSPLLYKLAENNLIKGASHITGGGIRGNLVRVLRNDFKCVIEKKKWDVPVIFEIIMKKGKISEREMFDVFNMGIGLILIVSPLKIEKVIKTIKKQKFVPYIIGEVKEGKKKEVIII